MNMYYRQNSIRDEIRETFKSGSMLTKLIYINLGVFILVKLAFVLFFLFTAQHELMSKSSIFQNNYLYYLELPTKPIDILHRPWTPITYMFLHFGFLHIIFNLLVLFWFGRIFLKYLNNKQLLTTYILGGLMGGLVYVISYNVFPGLGQGLVLGASGSIMAIVIAISFYHPDFEIYIPIIGQTKLKHVAIFYIVLDVLMIASDNAGGHITHLGGALYGYLFAMQLKRGKDLGKGFSNIMDSVATLFKPKPKLKVSYKSNAKVMDDFEYNKSKAETQKVVDQILDKIAKSGYDSLTKKEKEILFKMGNDKS